MKKLREQITMILALATSWEGTIEKVMAKE